MHSKPLLIAIAAFALTTSSAQAFFNDKEMEKAGFTNVQIEAFSEARKLQKEGKVSEARDLLLNVAKVDDEKIATLRKMISKEKGHLKSVNNFKHLTKKSGKEFIKNNHNHNHGYNHEKILNKENFNKKPLKKTEN